MQLGQKNILHFDQAGSSRLPGKARDGTRKGWMEAAWAGHKRTGEAPLLPCVQGDFMKDMLFHLQNGHIPAPHAHMVVLFFHLLLTLKKG